MLDESLHRVVLYLERCDEEHGWKQIHVLALRYVHQSFSKIELLLAA
jgi:hypothetical protein